MEIRRLSDVLGVEIIGLDLSKPVSPDDAQKAKKAFDEFGVAVFRRQNLTKENLVEGSKILGELERHPIEVLRDKDVPDLMVVSAKSSRLDIERPGEEVVGQLIWHTDLGYATQPSRGGILYGVKLPPEGGQTGFIDTAKAYDALDEATKARIEGLHIHQSYRFSMTYPPTKNNPQWKTKDGGVSPDYYMYIERFPDIIYPMVTTHPITQRKQLNCPPMWASEILEIPGKEGWDLIDRLGHHLTQDKFIHWHTWEEGDVLCWDNWRVNHAAAGSKAKYGRTMWRTTLKGGVTFGRNLAANEKPSAGEWRDTIAPFRIPAA